MCFTLCMASYVYKSLNARVVNVKYFRSIILVGVVYEILAKTLASRLKNVLGRLLLNTQNVFIKGERTFIMNGYFLHIAIIPYG